jgi:hypothetical protein
MTWLDRPPVEGRIPTDWRFLARDRLFDPNNMFEGLTLTKRIRRGVTTLWIGTLGIYLVRGGWRLWPPPWPVLSIVTYFGILAVAGVVGAAFHFLTDPLRASIGWRRILGNILPITLCLAIAGFGLIFIEASTLTGR